MKFLTIFMVCALLCSCNYPSFAQGDEVEVIIHELDSGEVNIIEIPAVLLPEGEGINVEDPKQGYAFLLDNFELIYGFIVILFGYISIRIPGLKKIKSGTYRIMTLAIIVGLGAWIFGLGSIWELTLSYAISTSFYQLLLKPVKRSERAPLTIAEATKNADAASVLLKRIKDESGTTFS